MDKLKAIMKYSQTLSIIGIILIFSAIMDISGSSLLVIKIRLGFGIAILGFYHILRPIAYLIEPD